MQVSLAAACLVVVAGIIYANRVLDGLEEEAKVIGSKLGCRAACMQCPSEGWSICRCCEVPLAAMKVGSRCLLTVPRQDIAYLSLITLCFIFCMASLQPGPPFTLHALCFILTALQAEEMAVLALVQPQPVVVAEGAPELQVMVDPPGQEGTDTERDLQGPEQGQEERGKQGQPEGQGEGQEQEKKTGAGRDAETVSRASCARNASCNDSSCALTPTLAPHRS